MSCFAISKRNHDHAGIGDGAQLRGESGVHRFEEPACGFCWHGEDQALDFERFIASRAAKANAEARGMGLLAGWKRFDTGDFSAA